MSDGTREGLSATGALKVILAGEPVPDERPSEAEFCAWVRSAPADATGDGYSESARLMAKYFVAVLEGAPDAGTYDLHKLYDEAKALAPVEDKEAFEGVTGFMVGWANNAARRCLALSPQPNPAIVTIEVEP